MKYYVTIYIDTLDDFEGFTHAFLCLTRKHLDELDKLTLKKYRFQWIIELSKIRSHIIHRFIRIRVNENILSVIYQSDTIFYEYHKKIKWRFDKCK